MSTINTNNSVYENLGLSQTSQSGQTQNSNELGQDAFMELMLAQLKNQNPLEPMENGDFLAQMAQFSTASGIDEMNASMQQLASSFNSNQALQASSLVGRQVLLASDSAQLDAGGNVEGAAYLPVSTDSMRVSIYDSSGQVVRTIDYGQQSSGIVDFNWDGMTDDGAQAPAGDYTIKAEANIDGQAQALGTAVVATVESVVLGQGGRDVTLNVAGQGGVPMSSISKIM